MISVAAHARIEDDGGGIRPLTDLELLMFFNLLVVAGSETTRNSIALGMVALIEHPDQLAALRDDRSLMPTAVEEILRWTSATLYNRRTATRARRAGRPGHRRRGQGDPVVAVGQPGRGGLRRPVPVRHPPDPNPHLTFGHRTHFCLGANLARLEIRVMLGEVLDRLEGFELGGPVERVRTNKHAGVSHVPLAFRPAIGPPVSRPPSSRPPPVPARPADLTVSSDAPGLYFGEDPGHTGVGGRPRDHGESER